MRPLEAVDYAYKLADHLQQRGGQVVAAKFSHRLVAAKLNGWKSFCLPAEQSTLQYAAEGHVLDPDFEMKVVRQPLVEGEDGQLFFGEAEVVHLADLPLYTVFNFRSEHEQQIFWLGETHHADSDVLVNLVEVKSGCKDTLVPCGDQPVADGDTLVSIAHRLICRSFPYVCQKLAKATEASGQILHLGSVTLLTNRTVPPAELAKFKALALPWRTKPFRVFDDLEDILPEKYRDFYYVQLKPAAFSCEDSSNSCCSWLW